MTNKKRMLVCTFVALAAGCFGAIAGGQISAWVHQQNCQQFQWGGKEICQAWAIPGALWQGSTTGFWVGEVVGALLAGLATQRRATDN
ncbi:MAG: hypothetical protein CLLPBCKN_003331 [Chroococcidiopsis cubana SAG 39.79]|jgi:hypothetical protein|uniref:Lipoprotein n=1 Tax=Chroococcidiopsis cubana SAG 39.79 TaxID=388085 RepID=A0AB37UG24_9CYAN|nr:MULTISPECIES: hypothetical protein [Chroococcidiopsis]MDZ4873935.1 hypothetical protein [Chroococcidiopsis cubana SAG 39.79]RUT10482.1 hypothetical protein DSM107010_42710 [Chroococcidiopsis cubana SAG 39.79]URD51547.1 hypothetical protein M5J74_06055 [Chroococcidiopsis sp. CCNUC1]